MIRDRHLFMQPTFVASADTPSQYGALLRAVEILAVIVAAIEFGLIPFVPSQLQSALLAYGLWISGICGLRRYLLAAWPSDRTILLMDALLVLSLVQPLALSGGTLIYGNVNYIVSDTLWDQNYGAGQVASVHVVFAAACVLGARLIRPAKRENTSPRHFSTSVIWLSELAVIVVLASRFLLLVAPDANEVVAYWLRIIVGFFQAPIFMVGVGSAWGRRASRVIALAALVIGALVMVSGSRQDFVFMTALLFAGFLYGKGIEGLAVMFVVPVVISVAVALTFVAGVMREDERGRSFEAALERLSSTGQTTQLLSGRQREDESMFLRWTSPSTHSVLVRMPSELAFEPDGLINLPVEIAWRFLPRFNWQGISDTDTPRHFELSNLGFLITWDTSVEFTTVADAWYRGGWLAIVAVGTLFGLSLQAIENAAYSGRLGILGPIIPVFVIAVLPAVIMRDFPNAFRTLLQAAAVGLLFLVITKVAAKLSHPSALQERHLVETTRRVQAAQRVPNVVDRRTFPDIKLLR